MIEFPRRWRIYAFLSSEDKTVIQEWARDIKGDKDLLARLNLRLDLLERHGSDLPPNMLAGTSFRNVDKLRIFGRNQTWRIMLCKGPINPNFEFTLLYAAQEKDRKLIPRDAYHRADQNRLAIIENESRRKLHERIK